MGDFSFTHTRLIPAGAAEVAPVDPTDARVFDLPDVLDGRGGTKNDSVYLLAQGGNLAYEIAFWNATMTASASFVVVATGTLTDGVPALVSFPADGARIYVRSTGVTAVDIRVSCAPVRASAAAVGAVGLATEATLAGIAATVATEATLAAMAGAVATEATLAGIAGVAANLGTEATLSTLATEATLGAVSATATAIAGSVDSVEALLGSTENGFTVVRTFNATVADAEPPVAGSFVAMTPQLGAVEVYLAPGMVFTGAVKPTAARIRVWGRTSTAPATIFEIDSFVELISRLEAVGSSFNSLKRYNSQVDEIFVTVTYLDGTNPSATSGTIYARPVAQSVVQSNHIKIDPVTKYPVTQDASWDGITGANKTARINDLYPPIPDPLVISETSRAAGATYYWPSSDGIDMDGYDALTTRYSITGAGASTTSTILQATIDGTNWDDVTLCSVDVSTGLSPTGPLTTGAGASATKGLMLYGVNWSKVRVAMTVAGAATGAVSCSFRRAKMGYST